MKGDKKNRIRAILRERPGLSNEQIHKILNDEGMQASDPLIYNVRREMRDAGNANEDFTPEQLRMAKALVMAVGSLSRCRSIISFLEDLSEGLES